jgi:molybdopterin synthase catalytic subunit
VVRAEVVNRVIDAAAVMGQVGAPEDGAVLLFLGTVRNHAEGESVGGMTYEAYEGMAAPVLTQIANEAAERLGTDRVVVVHRIGELAIGEVSVAIAVSSPHRAQAYDASRYVIEEIKKRLPVWKREHYTSGRSEWVEGVRPSPDTGFEAARLATPSASPSASGGHA